MINRGTESMTEDREMRRTKERGIMGQRRMNKETWKKLLWLTQRIIKRSEFIQEGDHKTQEGTTVQCSGG